MTLLLGRANINWYCNWFLQYLELLNVSVNVVANSNWSYLLISAPKVHWRVQLTAARRSVRFNKMHGALYALHVSVNNAFTRTVCKCLKRKSDHLITLQTWRECRYRNRGATYEVQNSFWINEQEAQLMLTTGSTRLAISRGQQIWYHSTCYI